MIGKHRGKRRLLGLTTTLSRDSSHEILKKIWNLGATGRQRLWKCGRRLVRISYKTAGTTYGRNCSRREMTRNFSEIFNQETSTDMFMFVWVAGRIAQQSHGIDQSGGTTLSEPIGENAGPGDRGVIPGFLLFEKRSCLSRSEEKIKNLYVTKYFFPFIKNFDLFSILLNYNCNEKKRLLFQKN